MLGGLTAWGFGRTHPEPEVVYPLVRGAPDQVLPPAAPRRSHRPFPVEAAERARWTQLHAVRWQSPASDAPFELVVPLGDHGVVTGIEPSGHVALEGAAARLDADGWLCAYLASADLLDDDDDDGSFLDAGELSLHPDGLVCWIRKRP